MPKIILILLLMTCGLLADDQQRLATANRLFEEAGQASLSDPDKSKRLYRDAILNYRFLIEEKGYASPELFSNTGNACFFAGDTGMAIVYYQKALKIDPGHRDIKHNLSYVRSMVIDELPQSIWQDVLSFVFFWHDWSVFTRTLVLAVFNCALWGLLLGLLFQKRKRLQKCAIVCAALSLLLGGSLLLTLSGFDNDVDGVITENEVVARQGNGHIYEPAFMAPLHSGTEFSILESRSNWLYVELLDGSKCWLPSQSITLIE